MGDRLGIRHQHALGQLQNQGLRVEAGGIDSVRHLANQLGVLQLTPGDVDADLHRGVCGISNLPAASIAGCLLKHPASKLHDQAALLGDADEAGRVQHPPLRMIPSHQRLDTVDGTALEHDDRLVVHDELFLVECGLQVVLELHSVQRRTGKRCFVLDVAGLSL